jgi:L-rhamnose mutarotase
VHAFFTESSIFPTKSLFADQFTVNIGLVIVRMEKRIHCLTLDLKDDQSLIDAYEKYHQKIWPEITESIKASGIEHMEIYRWETRLFMIIEVNNTFSFRRKEMLDSSNKKVREWENLMDKFQKKLQGGSKNMKWQRMKKIFDLKENG